MGEWSHHDVLAQLQAGDMLPACQYCIAVKKSVFSQVHILVDHVFYIFFGDRG